MPSNRVVWGGLNTWIVHAMPAGGSAQLAIVLCHGYGASGTDLVGLAEPLLECLGALRQRVVCLFPAAPLDLSQQGIPGGRAWWPIDLEALIYRPTPALLTALRTECPPGLPEARHQLLALLAQAQAALGLTARQCILGGFSQGAMLALDAALHHEEPVGGVGLLSAGLINERQWRPLALKRGSQLRVFQSHGRYDSILPFALGVLLRDLLREAGAALDFLEFPGDHEIPPQAVERLAALVQRVAAEAA
jgi:phospholipase/carboxylesterase